MDRAGEEGLAFEVSDGELGREESQQRDPDDISMPREYRGTGRPRGRPRTRPGTSRDMKQLDTIQLRSGRQLDEAVTTTPDATLTQHTVGYPLRSGVSPTEQLGMEADTAAERPPTETAAPGRGQGRPRRGRARVMPQWKARTTRSARLQEDEEEWEKGNVNDRSGILPELRPQDGRKRAASPTTRMAVDVDSASTDLKASPAKRLKTRPSMRRITRKPPSERSTSHSSKLSTKPEQGAAIIGGRKPDPVPRRSAKPPPPPTTALQDSQDSAGRLATSPPTQIADSEGEEDGGEEGGDEEVEEEAARERVEEEFVATGVYKEEEENDLEVTPDTDFDTSSKASMPVALPLGLRYQKRDDGGAGEANAMDVDDGHQYVSHAVQTDEPEPDTREIKDHGEVEEQPEQALEMDLYFDLPLDDNPPFDPPRHPYPLVDAAFHLDGLAEIEALIADPDWKAKLAARRPDSGVLGAELWGCFLDVIALLNDPDEEFVGLEGNHRFQAVYFHEYREDFQDDFDKISELIRQIESYARNPLSIPKVILDSLDMKGQGYNLSEATTLAGKVMATIRRSDIPEIFIPDCVLILQSIVYLMPEMESTHSSSGKTPEKRYTVTALELLDRVSCWILRLSLVAEKHDKQLTASVRLIREDVRKARNAIKRSTHREATVKIEDVDMSDAPEVRSNTEGNDPHSPAVSSRVGGGKPNSTPVTDRPATEKKNKPKKKPYRKRGSKNTRDEERAWTSAEYDAVFMALTDGESAAQLAEKLHRTREETERYICGMVRKLVSQRLVRNEGVVPRWLVEAEKMYFAGYFSWT